MAVYLVDEPFLEEASAFAKMDKDARLVLLQDAVYAAVDGRISGKAFALTSDISRRGLGNRLPKSVQVIDFPELVQMMENDRVVNFL